MTERERSDTVNPPTNRASPEASVALFASRSRSVAWWAILATVTSRIRSVVLAIVVAVATACGEPIERPIPAETRSAHPAATSGRVRSPRAADAGSTAVVSAADRDDVVRLLRDHGNADAARELVARGPEIMPLLAESLVGEDAAAHEGALRISQLLPDASLAHFVPLLGGDDAPRRAAASAVVAGLVSWWAVTDDAPAIVDAIAAGLAGADAPELAYRLRAIGSSGAHAPRTFQAVQGLIPDSDDAVLRAAAEALAAMGPAATSASAALWRRRLRPFEKNTTEDDVRHALWQIGPDHACVELLIAAARDPQSPLRSDAIRLLAQGGASPRVASVLESLLRDADEDVVRSAQGALQDLPGSEEISLAAALATGDGRDASPIARRPEAAPHVIAAARRGPATTRAAAVWALADVPAEFYDEATAAAREALDADDVAVRVAAVRYLWRREPSPPDEDKWIERALRDEAPEVRQSAIWRLGKREKGTQNASVAEMVAPFLADASNHVRFWAGNALQEIGTAPASAAPLIATNLRSSERLVRLGAIRAATVLGEHARPLAPSLVEFARASEFIGLALEAVAASGADVDEVREGLREIAGQSRYGLVGVLRAFGPRVAFLEPDARGTLLRDPNRANRDLLIALVGATADPASLYDWLREHAGRFDRGDVDRAMRTLGPVAMEGMVRSAVRGGRERHLIRKRVRELGELALEPLLTVARSEDPALAAAALHLLADTSPRRAAAEFAAHLRAVDPDVRAAAARGIAEAVRQGRDAGSTRAVLVALLADEPVVRAAALHALAAGGVIPEEALALVRAALRDADARVRIAAAEALHRATSETEEPLRVLRAELDVTHPSWGWFGGGGTPARTEDEYSDEAQLWAATARVIGRIGPPAAPLARSLVWAALRHGEPRMQRILVEAVHALGPEVSDAVPLLRRLATTRNGWLGFHETVSELDEALAACLRALGEEPPEPPGGF